MARKINVRDPRGIRVELGLEESSSGETPVTVEPDVHFTEAIWNRSEQANIDSPLGSNAIELMGKAARCRTFNESAKVTKDIIASLEATPIRVTSRDRPGPSAIGTICQFADSAIRLYETRGSSSRGTNRHLLQALVGGIERQAPIKTDLEEDF
jgi:hypothetical protein